MLPIHQSFALRQARLAQVQLFQIDQIELVLEEVAVDWQQEFVSF